jgi:hypothetical protein
MVVAIVFAAVGIFFGVGLAIEPTEEKEGYMMTLLAMAGLFLIAAGVWR